MEGSRSTELGVCLGVYVGSKDIEGFGIPRW